MIKSEKLNVDNVYPFWKSRGKLKPLRPAHLEITNNPFPNCLMCASKNSGKTTCTFWMIMKFMTNKTKLIWFSRNLLSDKDNVNAIKHITDKFGEDSVEVYKSLYDEEGNNILAEKIDEAETLNQREVKTKYMFPTMIIVWDDIPEEELKEGLIGEICSRNRHFGIITIQSTQRFKNTDVKSRDNLDLILLWKGLPKEKIKDMADFMTTDRKHFEKLYNYASGGDRNFLTFSKTDHKFRKNFDENIYIKDI